MIGLMNFEVFRVDVERLVRLRERRWSLSALEHIITRRVLLLLLVLSTVAPTISCDHYIHYILY